MLERLYTVLELKVRISGKKVFIHNNVSQTSIAIIIVHAVFGEKQTLPTKLKRWIRFRRSERAQTWAFRLNQLKISEFRLVWNEIKLILLKIISFPN